MQVALYRLLEEFAVCASKLRVMRKFCHDVLLGLPSSLKCRTYEAFAVSLQRCLTRLLQTTRSHEEELVLKSNAVGVVHILDYFVFVF